MALNQSLSLVAKILEVLRDSNQPLESRLVASEIVVKLLKAEPYGSLAEISSVSEGYSEVANQSNHMAHSEPKHRHPVGQSLDSGGTVRMAERP